VTATSGRGRMAAVLFTDLVGSTELLSRLGDTAYDGLRRAHFAALREAIGRSHGAEVKTTGDGLLATFPSAADAVGCAVGMQQAVDVHSRTAGVPLAIRVGVALGDVSFEEEDVFGTPVVEAARLVAAARSGQILATVLVRAVAGGRCAATFTDLGTLELKGLPAPVATCEVAWEPLPRSSVPVPALLTDIGRIFVGREAEVGRLEQLWNDAVSGERRAVFVAGEPGVGKTRLAAELALRVQGDGAMVLAGRCDEDLGVPYQPFVEALRHFVDHMPPEDLGRGLGRFSGELARLVPELTERVPDLPPPLTSDPETERYRLFDAVASWLRAASEDPPLLLVLDDLQWAAKPTLLLLRHVLQSPDLHRLLILGTYRDTELSHDHPLVEVVTDLRRKSGAERLSLSGLDSSGVAAFMERAAGHELDRDDAMVLARAIHAETEGNPFFVREVIRHLTETGGLRQLEGRWVTGRPVEELGIPEGVRDVVGRRVSRLSRDTNQALRVAAVVGAEFDLGIVQGAGGLGDETLLAALEEAVGARLVAEVSATRYRFAHALVRTTLYESLTAARKIALHRRVAQAIEALYEGALDDHLPALAHHWAKASAPVTDTAKAVDYAVRAGDRALLQLAHDEAVVYYAQARDLLDAAGTPASAPQRVELLISYGEAQRRAGQSAYRETLLDAAALARELGDATALARAALANSRGFFSAATEVDIERVVVLEAAVEAVGPADSEWRARLLADLVAELAFASEDERRDRLAAEALAIARSLGDPVILAHVLARCHLSVAPRRPDEMRQNVSELRSLAATLEDPTLSFWAATWSYIASLSLGDLDAYDRHLEEADHLAADSGQPLLRWMQLTARSTRSRIAGRLADAETFADQALQVGQTAGIPDAFRFYGANLFWLRYDQGRLGDLVRILERAATRPTTSPLVALSFALALCELDRHEEARPIFEEIAAKDFAAIAVNFTWLYGLTMAAEVCATLHDVERATVLYRHLNSHPDQFGAMGNVAATGSVSHYLGLLAPSLGLLEEADAHFTAATARHVGAPTWLARTQLEWARMLLIRRQPGDAERACELLGGALTTARELGLANVERRAVATLGQVS
jgi:class 3 adenylate cyclase